LAGRNASLRIAVTRYPLPLAAVPLHPFGVLATLAIQWTALVRRGLGLRTA
jgi:hypothetical protein